MRLVVVGLIRYDIASPTSESRLNKIFKSDTESLSVSGFTEFDMIRSRQTSHLFKLKSYLHYYLNKLPRIKL